MSRRIKFRNRMPRQARERATASWPEGQVSWRRACQIGADQTDPGLVFRRLPTSSAFGLLVFSPLPIFILHFAFIIHRSPPPPLVTPQPLAAANAKAVTFTVTFTQSARLPLSPTENCILRPLHFHSSFPPPLICENLRNLMLRPPFGLLARAAYLVTLGCGPCL